MNPGQVQVALGVYLHGERFGQYAPVRGVYVAKVLAEDGIPAGSNEALPEGCVSMVQIAFGDVTMWVPPDALETLDGEPYDRRFFLKEEEGGA